MIDIFNVWNQLHMLQWTMGEWLCMWKRACIINHRKRAFFVKAKLITITGKSGSEHTFIYFTRNTQLNHRAIVSQIVVPESAASALPGNLLEKQIMKFHFRLIETETLWSRRGSNLGFNKPKRRFSCTSKFENHYNWTFIIVVKSMNSRIRSPNSGSATKQMWSWAIYLTSLTLASSFIVWG